MSNFSGTVTKCKVCEKTVYLVDQMIVDEVIYHKFCFRCTHCKGGLKLGNYASLEGVLYCKPHFQQLFKQTGNIFKSFEDAIKEEKLREPPPESTTRLKSSGEKKPSKFASLFSGTQERCIACNKIVYPMEKLTLENNTYHKSCFKCSHGGCKLTTATYQALEGKLFCRPHYSQLFLEKGNYAQFGSNNNSNNNNNSTANNNSTNSTPVPAPIPVPAEGNAEIAEF